MFSLICLYTKLGRFIVSTNKFWLEIWKDKIRWRKSECLAWRKSGRGSPAPVVCSVRTVHAGTSDRACWELARNTWVQCGRKPDTGFYKKQMSLAQHTGNF